MSMQEATSPTRTPRGRPVLLLGTSLVIITAALFLYGSVLTSVSYEVDLDPSLLYAGESESASLVLPGLNRLGGRVPHSAPRFRIAIEEGADLVHLEVAEDSARYTLHTVGEAGTVVLYCYTEEWPFPMIATLRIIAPMAQTLLFMRKNA